MEAADELQIVRGANREEEIGGIVDFYQRQTGNKAVLFDDIPGYPSGYRAVANILTSTKRIKMTLGLPADATDMDLIHFWRKYMKENKTIPPVQVPTGLVLENVHARRRRRPAQDSRRRNGTSTTAATTSAPATW